MAEYFYKTVIYHNTSGVVNVPASNATDISDFTTNHASSVVDVTQLETLGTSFIIEKTYSDFDALVVTPFDWGDVKCVATDKAYSLYLVSNSPI